jgi:hypothetical protein
MNGRMGTRTRGAWRARIDTEIRELKQGVDILFGKMDAQSGRLDAITTALHELRGAAGPSMKDMVIIVTACAGLFASVAGGIIYLARGGNSEALSALNTRLVRIETVMQMQAVFSKRAPGTWVPDKLSAD